MKLLPSPSVAYLWRHCHPCPPPSPHWAIATQSRCSSQSRRRRGRWFDHRCLDCQCHQWASVRLTSFCPLLLSTLHSPLYPHTHSLAMTSRASTNHHHRPHHHQPTPTHTTRSEPMPLLPIVSTCECFNQRTLETNL